MNGARAEWSYEFPATLDALEGFFLDFKRWRETACEGRGNFEMDLLLREALTNSVVHGCRFDPRKRVCCRIRIGRGRLVIAIRDDGDGFDWRGRWNVSRDMQAEGGRGIEILRHYANALRFNSKGNAVTMIRRFETL